MTIPEHILIEAFARLDNGETAKQIAANYADYQHELEGLLSVALMAKQLPTITPPAPYKRFRFTETFADKAITSTGFMQFLTYMRIAAIPIGLVIVLLGGRAAVNATEDSLPGDKLYSIKRATEEARLTLARNQEKQAAIHVELLQKRLEDVRKAADSGNEDKEAAALSELQTQTKVTFAEVAPVATANAISKQDSSLLDSLVAVNKEQKVVLSSISETTDTENAKTMAMSAINDNKEIDITLAKIIATVQDQTLIDLPNKTTVTGDIVFISDNKITVEKNTFIIDPSTIMTGSDGQAITDVKAVNGKVTVTGTRTENESLVAKQILVLPTDGSVKGDVIAKPKPRPTNPITPTNTNTNTPTTESSPAPAATVEQPKAMGGYITESNDPQYSE